MEPATVVNTGPCLTKYQRNGPVQRGSDVKVSRQRTKTEPHLDILPTTALQRQKEKISLSCCESKRGIKAVKESRSVFRSLLKAYYVQALTQDLIGDRGMPHGSAKLCTGEIRVL